MSKHLHWSFLHRLVLPPDRRSVEVHSYITSVLAAALTSRTANEGNFCMAPGAAGQPSGAVSANAPRQALWADDEGDALKI